MSSKDAGGQGLRIAQMSIGSWENKHKEKCWKDYNLEGGAIGAAGDGPGKRKDKACRDEEKISCSKTHYFWFSPGLRHVFEGCVSDEERVLTN